jgi:hypothetical protein
MHMTRIGRTFTGITAALITAYLTFTPGATAAPRTPNDCTRTAPADHTLCHTVQAQHAYGWTDRHGHPQNWNANGRALVHEITHQGYTKAEMHDALTGAHRDYRTYVTHVTFNMDEIRKRCGSDGMGAVQFIDGDGRPGGDKYTWKRVICP